MPNIEGDTFRGFYKSEIEKNREAIFAIPDNIRVINFIFLHDDVEAQRDATPGDGHHGYPARSPLRGIRTDGQTSEGVLSARTAENHSGRTRR